MDRVNGGTAKWEQYSRVVHELHFTIPDDALSPISEGDDMLVTLQSREGAAMVKLSHQQVNRLLFGDPRTRARKAHSDAVQVGY